MQAIHHGVFQRHPIAARLALPRLQYAAMLRAAFHFGLDLDRNQRVGLRQSDAQPLNRNLSGQRIVMRVFLRLLRRKRRGPQQAGFLQRNLLMIALPET